MALSLSARTMRTSAMPSFFSMRTRSSKLAPLLALLAARPEEPGLRCDSQGTRLPLLAARPEEPGLRWGAQITRLAGRPELLREPGGPGLAVPSYRGALEP